MIEKDLDKEIERLNNIINELEKWLEEQHQFIIEIPAYIKEISIEHKTMEMLEKENKRLNNIINELGKYLEQRKEEWNNSRNKEDISSYHYIMLIINLLEIIDKENKNE